MNSLFAALLICGAFVAPSRALEVKGVAVPDSAEVSGKKLTLNGAGVRRKVVFNVYVGALYLEEQSADGVVIIRQDKTRRMELTFLRNVDSAAISEAIEKGFAKNAADTLPALKARLADFRKLIPDLRKGDKLALTYAPGQGLAVEYNGKPAGSIPGKDFSDALFSVWLGGYPADNSLRTALLSRK
ncbi:MAG: chalcone isomerase family protein [Elusimicrobiales bacterium]|nr:chalcone isomerase family protein [Elusimicrobiales bacterium]